jgi:hypothetical protein
VNARKGISVHKFCLSIYVAQGEEQDASLIAPLTNGPSEALKLYRDQSRGTREVRTRVLRAFSVAHISLLPQCTPLGYKQVFNTARTSMGYDRVHEVGYVPHEVLDYNPVYRQAVCYKT